MCHTPLTSILAGSCVPMCVRIDKSNQSRHGLPSTCTHVWCCANAPISETPQRFGPLVHPNKALLFWCSCVRAQPCLPKKDFWLAIFVQSISHASVLCRYSKPLLYLLAVMLPPCWPCHGALLASVPSRAVFGHLASSRPFEHRPCCFLLVVQAAPRMSAACTGIS